LNELNKSSKARLFLMEETSSIEKAWRLRALPIIVLDKWILDEKQLS